MASRRQGHKRSKRDVIGPKHADRAFSLEDVRANICDPLHWIDKDGLVEILRNNPSLRGMVYGYVAEVAFVQFLEKLGITEHFKPDDHKRKTSKSDRTFMHLKKQYTLQLKSMQTNTIKEKAPGRFVAKVQNDASDSRKILLPNGSTVTTVCYKVGEYDVLGVTLQPFTGEWRFAFKKNSALRRTTHKKYAEKDRRYLLSTLEDISWPLTDDWTEDLFSLLKDPKLGHAGKPGIKVEVDEDLFKTARRVRVGGSKIRKRRRA